MTNTGASFLNFFHLYLLTEIFLHIKQTLFLVFLTVVSLNLDYAATVFTVLLSF